MINMGVVYVSDVCVWLVWAIDKQHGFKTVRVDHQYLNATNSETLTPNPKT